MNAETLHAIVSRAGSLPAEPVWVWVSPVLPLPVGQAGRPSEIAKHLGTLGVLSEILQKMTTFDGAGIGSLGVLPEILQRTTTLDGGKIQERQQPRKNTLAHLASFPESCGKRPLLGGAGVGALGALPAILQKTDRVQWRRRWQPWQPSATRGFSIGGAPLLAPFGGGAPSGKTPSHGFQRKGL